MSRTIQPLFSCYSDKVNIYQNPDFILLAAIKQIPPPSSAPIFNFTTPYGQAYPVPRHQPPFPSCGTCSAAPRDCCKK